VSSYDKEFNFTSNNQDICIKEITKDNVFIRIHKNVKENELFISIRGTDDFKDWKHNINKFKTKFLNIDKVHSGFLKHLNCVYDEILYEIKKYNKINIIGHSLGGAVGILLGSKLCYLNSKIQCNVITYGSPRVGDKEFKKLCNNLYNFKCYRVYNKNDIVTKLPYFGFYHIGLKYKLKSKHIPIYKFKETHSVITYMSSLYIKHEIEYLKSIKKQSLINDQIYI
jgi:hypothetical protein